jgi:hypothetical protein
MKQPPELEPMFRSGPSLFADRREGLTYRHFQMGMPGRWGGVGIAELGLKDPVDFQEVDRVFHSGIDKPNTYRNPTLTLL